MLYNPASVVAASEALITNRLHQEHTTGSIEGEYTE